MAFWILVAVVVVTVVIATIQEDSFYQGILSGFIATVVGGLVLVVLMFAVPANSFVMNESDFELKALNTGSNQNHSYFLSGGQVNGVRVINYIYTETEGEEEWSVVAQAKGNVSRIFEDKDVNPTIRTSEIGYENGWLFPWPYPSSTKNYDFHIPEGSIIENYEVTNE